MEVTYSVHEGVIGAEQGRVCHPVFSVQTCWAPIFLHIHSPPGRTLYTEASLQPDIPRAVTGAWHSAALCPNAGGHPSAGGS